MTVTIIVFIVLLLIGLPIAFVLGVSALYHLVIDNIDMLPFLAQRFYAGIDSYLLIAAPLFMLAGEIMNRCGITRRLIDFCNLLVGRIRGGLAYVNVLDSTIFAGITGSAISDVSALGSIIIPEMKKDGYKGAYCAALTATTAVLGPTIPPSIIVVVYGAITNTSIIGMFAASILPGLLLGLSNALVIFFTAKKKGLPKKDFKVTPKEAFTTVRNALPALCLPVIILLGMLVGVFTPTEAAAVTAAAAIVIGFFIYRSLSLKDIYHSLAAAAKTSCLTLVIVGFANVFCWLLANNQVPQAIAQSILGLSSNPAVIMALVLALLLFVGTWMDTLVACMLLAPFLAVIGQMAGFDPIHFGVVVILTLNLGLITPPVGLCLFTASTVSGEKLDDVVREAWPYIGVMAVTVILVAFCPEIIMWLPRLLKLL